ncbi:hypothetical protein C8R44DRAFT_878718 [Mycena epipterygia]|nr:hypothetical protein C8R44DRAFT_878718 [Mycena epipterygia]
MAAVHSTEDATLANALGAVFLDVIFSAILFGVSSLQVYYYYHYYPHDTLLHKCSVALLWCLDATHLVLATFSTYHYGVLGFGDVAGLGVVSWSTKVRSHPHPHPHPHPTPPPPPTVVYPTAWKPAYVVDFIIAHLLPMAGGRRVDTIGVTAPKRSISASRPRDAPGIGTPDGTGKEGKQPTSGHTPEWPYFRDEGAKSIDGHRDVDEINTPDGISGFGARAGGFCEVSRIDMMARYDVYVENWTYILLQTTANNSSIADGPHLQPIGIVL